MTRIALVLVGLLFISPAGGENLARISENLPQPIELPLPGSNATMTFVPVFLFSEGQVLPKQAEKLTNIRSFETKDGSSYYYHYYLAKTEVTREQWDAMAGLPGAENEAREAEAAEREAEAAEAAERKANQDEAEGQQIAPIKDSPKRYVSPSVIKSVVKAYNAWLREKHPTTLPAENIVLGEVGLPTSDEWEFAARGGKVVKPDDFNKETPYENLDILSNHETLFRPPSQGEIAAPASVTERTISSLGLYGMLGNVQEVVDDEIDRGGVRFSVVRGGDFMTKPKDIDLNLLRKNTVMKKLSSPKLGFRLALTRPKDDRVRHRLLLGNSKVPCEWVRFGDHGFWMSTDEMSAAPSPPAQLLAGKEGSFKKLTGLQCRFPKASEWLEASKILDLDGSHGEYVKEDTEIRVIGRADLDWIPESKEWLNPEFSGWQKPLREKDRLAKTSAEAPEVAKLLPMPILQLICENRQIANESIQAFSSSIDPKERAELYELFRLQRVDGLQKKVFDMRVKRENEQRREETFRYRWVIDPP